MAICEKIRQVLGNRQISFGFPVEVADKAELCREIGKDKPFGDVDVIVAVGEEVENKSILGIVKRALGNEDGKVIHNDNIHMFLSKETFQIDLMFCKLENLQFLLAYKSNNDFGGLLGHLLIPLGLKWSNLGLVLKLETVELSGVGTCRADIVLTSDLSVVCNFLGLPGHSLDGRTRMTSNEVCEVLTGSKAFFATEFDEKYKLKKRRRKRPVTDAFFTYLENNHKNLEKQTKEVFKNDEVRLLFNNYIDEKIPYEEYIEKVSEYFSKGTEVKERFNSLKENSKRKQILNSKFNFQVLCSWFPGVEQSTCGKIITIMNREHLGADKHAFDAWIEQADIEDIKTEARRCKEVLYSNL